LGDGKLAPILVQVETNKRPMGESVASRGFDNAWQGFSAAWQYGASLASFRRAIAFAEDTGNLNRVADAAVAAFQELGEHLITSEGQDIASGLTLAEGTELLEHDYIKRALELYHGSITHAARSLGMSHQTLNYMLHTRHKDLLGKRTPVWRRPRKG
jgi:hypothetical protein